MQHQPLLSVARQQYMCLLPKIILENVWNDISYHIAAGTV